jgi:hypothetical protein
MAMAEMIPSLDDKELANLHANALRLAESGQPKQQAQAAELLPLIDAELAQRKAKLPPPKARKTPAKKAAAPTGAAPKKAAAPRKKAS